MTSFALRFFRVFAGTAGRDRWRALAALAVAASVVSGCESLLARAPHDSASCTCYQDRYAPSTTPLLGLKWPW